MRITVGRSQIRESSFRSKSWLTNGIIDEECILLCHFEVDTQTAALMKVCGLPAVVSIVEMWVALGGHLLPAVRTEKHVQMEIPQALFYFIYCLSWVCAIMQVILLCWTSSVTVSS